MPNKCSPEQSAIYLLELAIEAFQKEPGEALPIMSLASEWDTGDLEPDNFGVGIDYALSRGWLAVESTTSLPKYTLTNEGYMRR